MGPPFWVNACGKPVAPATAIEGSKEPATKPTWQLPRACRSDQVASRACAWNVQTQTIDQDFDGRKIVPVQFPPHVRAERSTRL